MTFVYVLVFCLASQLGCYPMKAFKDEALCDEAKTSEIQGTYYCAVLTLRGD